MLWEVEIRPSVNEIDREGLRIVQEAHDLRASTISRVETARSFLLQGGGLNATDIQRAASILLVDPVAEKFEVREI